MPAIPACADLALQALENVTSAKPQLNAPTVFGFAGVDPHAAQIGHEQAEGQRTVRLIGQTLRQLVDQLSRYVFGLCREGHTAASEALLIRLFAYLRYQQLREEHAVGAHRAVGH